MTMKCRSLHSESLSMSIDFGLGEVAEQNMFT